MKNLLKRVVLAALGVVITLSFWTVRGWFTDEASASLSNIPKVVWDGGGGTVVIEVETTGPARVSASFETRNGVDDDDHKFLDSWEKVGPGHHTFQVEVPPNVGGTAEVSAEDPQVGAQVRIQVKVDGQVVAEDSGTLTEPLQSGYGFFAQVHLEDHATGKLDQDD